MLNKMIIETFQNNCNEIYKLNEECAEQPTYLLIVDDVHSIIATDCHDLYYILLGKIERYFEIKILTKKQLESSKYMNYKKIY